MIHAPSLWGLIPLVVFIITIFRRWNPIASIVVSMIVGAILSGSSFTDIAKEIGTNGMTNFLAYIGLVIIAGGGLGRIAERTGVSRNLVTFIINKVGVNTRTKAMLGTMLASTVMAGLFGTLAGGNAVIAPVVIPVVAAAGLSSSVVAILFHGAGIAGLLIGPFSPPVITFMQLTGLSYPQYLLFAGLPVAVILWIISFVYSKKIASTTLLTFPYSEEDLMSFNQQEQPDAKQLTIAKQSTLVFLISLVGLIIYGIATKGGAGFAIFVILFTALVTGLAGRMSPNELADTFVEGAKPLLWIFFQFVLFTPFMDFIDKMGGFEALKNLLMPSIEHSGRFASLILMTIVNLVGIPGAAVAHSVLMNKMFIGPVKAAHIPMTIWALALLVGSQMPFFLYPTGDAIGSMGIARSKDLKNIVLFGVITAVAVFLLLVVFALFM
ncbi:TRAP transporter large permease subunit [Alicyclobacillus macrosporangiidus]|uniref:TRAP transporter large permease subunit n=1 Tax=Alicyclobacillus macrosporangiidus TaxID=392015 RepID=UPI000495C904|nr:TRAP transporter large permease subunit [Alicyclobacillus macrosporangiidus]